MNRLWMIGIAPTSWRLGLVRRNAVKSVWALGPLRFASHYLNTAPTGRS